MGYYICMRKLLDLTGQIFGRLTVTERTVSGTKAKWQCNCSCGNVTIVSQSHLRNGHTKSCGCWEEESRHNHRKTHGYSHHRTKDGRKVPSIPEYSVWCGMRARCRDVKNSHYKYYGGKGIKVCDRWEGSFLNFLNDMGRRPPRHLIDRIDSNGNYEPSNCRWVSAQLSVENRNNVVWLTYMGRTQTISAWGRELKVPASRLRYRYRAGHTIEDILFKPALSIPFREALTHKIPD